MIGDFLVKEEYKQIKKEGASRDKKRREQGIEYMLELKTKSGSLTVPVDNIGLRNIAILETPSRMRYGLSAFPLGTKAFIGQVLRIVVHPDNSQQLLILYKKREIIPNAVFLVVKRTNTGGVQEFRRADIKNAFISNRSIEVVKVSWDSPEKSKYLNVFEIQYDEMEMRNH